MHQLQHKKIFGWTLRNFSAESQDKAEVIARGIEAFFQNKSKLSGGPALGQAIEEIRMNGRFIQRSTGKIFI